MDIEAKEIVRLGGVLKKVLYKNEENSYVIAVLENGQKVCGKYFETDIEKLVGEDLIFSGNFNTHKKYGIQFEFDTIELKESELFFFLTKIVKGVGKNVAKELLEKYNEDEIVKIIENSPNELLKISGIKEKKLQMIVDSWKEYSHLREIGSFLSKFGVTNKLINKVYELFGEVPDLIDKLKQNPYMLTKIKGVGFKRADEIAQSIGIDKQSAFRIESCINFTLKEYCENEGNSSISKDKLLTLMYEALEFQKSKEIDFLLEKAIDRLISKEELYQTSEDRYAPQMLYFAESKIINFFKKRVSNIALKKIVSNLDEYIEKKQKTLGFELSNEQKKAVKLINEGNNTILLIGYAGTGKSTSSRAVLELLEEVVGYDEVICTALSGIASQRIADTTGYKSATIQSLLISHKEKDYFPYKVILLDEASMVNSIMFYQIISKISEDSVFIIVGDDGQLPAIGAGNILADCIKFELAPICKLTKIYRQNENQAIALIANDIRKAILPDFEDKHYDDFKFFDVSIANYYQVKNSINSGDFALLREENTNKILSTILQIGSKYLKEAYTLIQNKEIAKFLTLFQVITPMKGGVLGAENLNLELQKLFNSNRTKGKETRSYEYKLGDKVIHTKNENMKTQTMSMYKNGSSEFIEKRVFNGQLGLVIKIDFDDEKLIVLYPNDDMVVFYDFDSLDYLLSLAYALTIHKTQGMEYNVALIPISFSHYIMHNTKLLYTAITRAKEMCYIVGEKEAFKIGCKKIETTIRQSVINDLLG
ncbi:MAG: AAA family ATPase [Arcobacteraceae bacterium]|nr:AAA family ATPase [Arcobacteraceae bacterium]